MNKSQIKKTILSIDTSCDETSAAVTRGRRILSNIISTQITLHKKWGGVVPDIARRAHKKKIEPVIEKALQRAHKSINDIDYIAVTKGPGLAIALEVGIKKAKEIAIQNDIPLIPLNHIEAHLLSPLALNSKGNWLIEEKHLNSLSNDLFPALGLVVSGAHTDLIYIKDFVNYQILGETLDDAVGECFDKVARMLNLGYPGGPIITQLTKKHRKKEDKNKTYYQLPTPMRKSQDYNFSYSGLKTACLYKIKDNPKILNPKETRRFCNDFLKTIIDSLEIKLEKALKKNEEINSVFIGGGVSNNELIIRSIGRLTRKYNKSYYYPPKEIRTDNAAMIGILGHLYTKFCPSILLSDKAKITNLDREPQLQIS